MRENLPPRDENFQLPARREPASPGAARSAALAPELPPGGAGPEGGPADVYSLAGLASGSQVPSEEIYTFQVRTRSTGITRGGVRHTVERVGNLYVPLLTRTNLDPAFLGSIASAERPRDFDRFGAPPREQGFWDMVPAAYAAGGLLGAPASGVQGYTGYINPNATSPSSEGPSPTSRRRPRRPGSSGTSPRAGPPSRSSSSLRRVRFGARCRW